MGTKQIDVIQERYPAHAGPVLTAAEAAAARRAAADARERERSGACSGGAQSAHDAGMHRL